jgi:hypothetical protein
MSDVYRTFVSYFNAEGFYALIIGGLIIFIDYVVEYINGRGALCPGTRRVKYFYELYFRIYYCKRGFMPRYKKG